MARVPNSSILWSTMDSHTSKNLHALTIRKEIDITLINYVVISFSKGFFIL